ncbi:MAG: CHAT domain-containing protein [Bacteroidota bacterium]
MRLRLKLFLGRLIKRSMIGVTALICFSFQLTAQDSSKKSIDVALMDRDSLIGLAYEHHMWAVRNYTEPGMLDSSIIRAEKALAIREELWKDSVTINLGKAYHNLGAFEKERGNFDKAKRYLNNALAVYMNEDLVILTKKDSNRVLISLLELGKVYKEEGDFISAEEYFNLVIEQAKDRKNTDKIRGGVVNLTSTYVDAYQFERTIRLSEEYKSYFDDNQEIKEELICKYYNNLGSAYFRSGVFDKAISNFNKAKLYNKSDAKTQTEIYTNLATALRNENRMQECRAASEQGRIYALRTQNPKLIAISHLIWARYYEHQSQGKKALSAIQDAIKSMVPTFRAMNDLVNPNPIDLGYVVEKNLLLRIFFRKTQILAVFGEKDNQKEIIELFKLGDAVIDNMQSDHFMDDTKLHWRSAAFPFYEKALTYCYEEGLYDDAFYYLEKSKAVLLLEGYSFNEAISKTKPAERDRFLSLKMEVRQLLKEKESNSVETIVNAQRSFENYIDSLSIKYPRLFQKFDDQVLLSLGEFRNRFVSDSTVFIHYFHGKERVYALGVESESSIFLDLGDAKEIDTLIAELKDFFFHPSQIDNNFAAYKKTSLDVYTLLLKPFIKPELSEVVILPDGPIATIPFECLISSGIVEPEPRYVIQDRLIRYSFSGSILSNLKDSEFRAPLDVVTFMPFADKKNKQGSQFSGIGDEDLATAKKNGLRVKSYIGKNASRSRLISFNERLPILHFSSHGFEEEGTEPQMLLADSSFALSELFATSLPADMVFLSACRTNLGENAYGEGIQSMARGFTFAGANSVISSLWNVLAAPNSNIVSRFYENLSTGQTKHLSLHNAKLSYLNDAGIPAFEKTPYYWAGLVYYGESDHILKPKRESGISWMHGLAAFLIVVLGYFTTRKIFNS